MRIAITATVAAAAALTAASMLGVATAEAPTTPQLRTLSVGGVATETIDQSASAGTATAVYHQGLLDAVADGQTKAQLLAGKLGAALGPVQSVVENGGYINCVGVSESGNAEYEGAQPDFGSPGTSLAAAPARAGAARPLVGAARPGRRGKAHKRPSAKAAIAGVCTLSAQVSLVYPLS